MKNIISAIIIGLCIVWATYIYATHPKVGRYELFQGRYTIYDYETKSSELGEGLFKIDTKTGRVEDLGLIYTKEKLKSPTVK